MAKSCKRWLPSFLILLLVIGLLAGCANSEQSVNSKANQVQASNKGQEGQEGQETDKASDEQPSSAAPSETPEATQSPSKDKDQDIDKATDNAGDKQATPSPKPKQTNVPKLDDQKTKPTAKPNKTDETVNTKPVTPVATPQPAQTVTISIVADKETGTVLAPTAVEIKKDDTVLEVLKKITRKNKIQMEYRGVKGAAYIEGIDNIYEFDFGAKSGGMYRVNGEFPNKGAGSFKVKEGDVIEWLYTTDLGEDIGAKYDE
jgi:outer membrane biosynthesis protein TonB